MKVKIISDGDDFECFQKYWEFSEECLIDIIYCGNNHPIVEEISLVFFFFIKENIIFVSPQNHTESYEFKLNLNLLNEFNNKKYCFDKKRIISKFKFKNLIDLNLQNFLKDGIINNINPTDFKTEAHFHYLNKNKYIPILKHIESFKKTLVNFKIQDFRKSIKNYDKWDNFLNTLFEIESNGIFLNIDEFKKYYKDSLEYVIDNKIYSYYNIYTLTGRPSNTFNKINFLALNKKNDCRKSFVSRFGNNGRIVTFDYQSYHPKLLCSFLNIKGYDNFYLDLSKQILNKNEISIEEISDLKKIVFEILYSEKEYDISIDQVPFIFVVQKFKNYLWEQMEKYGCLDIPNGHRIFKKNIENNNKGKLLNYFMQGFETASNITVLSRINQFIRSFESKMILYTYDSITIDFNVKDGLELIKQIKKEMECDGKFSVEIKNGLYI